MQRARAGLLALVAVVFLFATFNLLLTFRAPGGSADGLGGQSRPDVAKLVQNSTTEAAPSPFVPTKEWQEVLQNQPVPPGLQIKTDLKTQKTFARLRQSDSTPGNTDLLVLDNQYPTKYPDSLKGYVSEVRRTAGHDSGGKGEVEVLEIMDRIMELVSERDVGLAFSQHKNSTSLFLDMVTGESVSPALRRAAARVLQAAVENLPGSIHQVFSHHGENLVRRLLESPYEFDALTVLEVLAVNNCRGASDFWQYDWTTRSTDKSNKFARLLGDVVATLSQFTKLAPLLDMKPASEGPHAWQLRFSRQQVAYICDRLQDAFRNEVEANTNHQTQRIGYYHVPTRFIRSLNQMNAMLRADGGACWGVECHGDTNSLGVHQIKSCQNANGRAVPRTTCVPTEFVNDFARRALKMVEFDDSVSEQDQERLLSTLNEFSDRQR